MPGTGLMEKHPSLHLQQWPAWELGSRPVGRALVAGKPTAEADLM